MQRLGRQRAGPLRYSGPPRPVPLPERPPQGKLRTDSTYDWREIGEQVMHHKLYEQVLVQTSFFPLHPHIVRFLFASQKSFCENILSPQLMSRPEQSMPLQSMQAA